MKKLPNFMGPWAAMYVPVSVVILMAVGALFIVQPLVQKLISDQGALEKSRAQLNFLSAKVSQLRRLDSALVGQRLSLVEGAIPSTKDALTGYLYLQQVARASGVSLDTLTVSPGNISSGSGNPADTVLDRGMSFQISVSGDKSGVTKFIESFAKPTFPLFLIRSVTLTYQGARTIGAMTIAMMWLSPPSSFGGETRPVDVLTSGEETFLEWLAKFKSQETNLVGQSVGSPSGIKVSLF